jgi:hypothetical protein
VLVLSETVLVLVIEVKSQLVRDVRCLGRVECKIAASSPLAAG